MPSRITMAWLNFKDLFKRPTRAEKRMLKDLKANQILAAIQLDLAELIPEYLNAIASGKPEKITPMIMELAAKKRDLQALLKKDDVKNNAELTKQINETIGKIDDAMNKDLLAKSVDIIVDYANKKFPPAKKVFVNSFVGLKPIERRAQDYPKGSEEAEQRSLVYQAHCGAGTFVEKAYHYPYDDDSRDQNVIDVMNHYGKQANKDVEIDTIANLITYINRMRSTLDMLQNRAKRTDLSASDKEINADDINGYNGAYRAALDQIKKIKDPKVRSSIEFLVTTQSDRFNAIVKEQNKSRSRSSL